MSLGFLFSFSHSFAAVIELPLDLLPVRILHRKHHWDDNFYHGVATVSEAAGNFAASFSLRFLSISMLILVRLHCQLISVTWVSLERSFNPAELQYRWCQFWSKVLTSEVKQRPTFIKANKWWHRSQWVKLGSQFFLSFHTMKTKVGSEILGILMWAIATSFSVNNLQMGSWALLLSSGIWSKEAEDRTSISAKKRGCRICF